MKKEKSFTHSTPLALTALRLLTLTRAPEMRERERERERAAFFQQGRGVRQGCNLSPTLFNIYINELAEALDRSGSIPGLALHDSEVKCLLYADDLVLLSPTAEGLQHSLALLEQYCEEWALTVNLDKTRVMVFQKKARSQGNIPVHLQRRSLRAQHQLSRSQHQGALVWL